jgi:hypothetical protein
MPILPTPSRFYTVPPCRAFDSREADGPQGGPALTDGRTRFIQLARRCGVSPTARSVYANLTIVAPDSPGHLRLGRDGSPVPEMRVLSFSAGQTRASNVIAPLGPDGGVAVSPAMAVGKGHLIVDVAGFFE